MPAMIRVALTCDHDGCTAREEIEVTPYKWADNAGWALSEECLPEGWTREGEWAWGFAYLCPAHPWTEEKRLSMPWAHR